MNRGRQTKERCVVWDNQPVADSICWLEDATADRQLVESAVGRTVVDRTPNGVIRPVHPIRQIPCDISRRKKPDRVQGLLRGVLARYSEFSRIGVIAHSTHTEPAQSLGRMFDQRIKRVAHFGGGEDRASNSWYTQCDLIVVAGTPRVPIGAVVERLFQTGQFDAVERDGNWGDIHWTGRTETEQCQLVVGRGFRDETWRLAHQSLVRAAIIQAAGRGRGLNPDGCEVVVLSNEDCGFTLAVPAEIKPVTARELTALELLTELAPKKYFLGTTSVTTRQLANELGVSTRQARGFLSRLEEHGLARRVSERGGWLPTSGPFADSLSN